MADLDDCRERPASTPRSNTPPPTTVLGEDEVIDAVLTYLNQRSWQVVSRCRATQRGPDLVVERGTERLIIEAKGAGSSKPGTARFGRRFSSDQVFDHVAKAVLKALRVIEEGNTLAAIALPDDANHRTEVSQISSALERLGCGVFWVSAARAVTVESPWEP